MFCPIISRFTDANMVRVEQSPACFKEKQALMRMRVGQYHEGNSAIRQGLGA